jgi:hypothetical protein
MKKSVIFAVAILAATILTGCQSAYHIGGGMPRTLPGVIVADQKSGGYIAPKMNSMKDVVVLGPVASSVSCSNILLLLSAGDVSIAKAKELAVQRYPDADDVVNVEIDCQHYGLLSIFNTVTMYYRGIAIKYKK